MQSKLSIITINKNNSIGLKKTIESVLAQNYDNFEFIIIDGSSTDDSIEVIESFNNLASNQQTNTSTHQPSSYWISEPDTGVYQAMNKGIKEASGEYLLFLNSGDFLIHTDALRYVFETDSAEDIIAARCQITRKGKVVHTTHPPENITFGTLYYEGLNHQSTLIKRELFTRYGFYDETFLYNADIEFWYRCIILHQVSVRSVPVILSCYNLEGMSTLESQSEAFREELDRIYQLPLFQKFIPDYDVWRKKKDELKPLFWIKSKKLIYFPLLLLYNFSQRLVRFLRQH
jgi:glycosyltransferase involved in cell wall biosynthesis